MKKIEKRKVQLTGGSTYIISLPVTWIRDLGIKQGDELFFSQLQDRSLVLTPKPEPKDDVYSATIQVGLKDKRIDVIRLIISYYLVGYDIIKLVFQKAYSANDRKWIKESVRKRLIALEVIEESSEWVLFQSLLNYTQFPLDRAMSNILRIVQSMLMDSKKALMELDRNLAREVIQRDIEVDRFYLLIVRQLKAALRNPELARDLGMSNTRECLGYRLVVKNIERIADHSEIIAEYSLKISKIAPEIMDQLTMICELNEKIFDTTIKCLDFKDMNSVNAIIEESQRSIESIRNLDKTILENPHLSDRIQFNSVSESLKRIAGHSADIAEVILNMSIPEPDTV